MKSLKKRERDVSSVFVQGKAQQLEPTASLLRSASLSALAKVWKPPLTSPGAHPPWGSSTSQLTVTAYRLSPANRAAPVHCYSSAPPLGKEASRCDVSVIPGSQWEAFPEGLGQQRRKAISVVLFFFFLKAVKQMVERETDKQEIYTVIVGYLSSNPSYCW